MRRHYIAVLVVLVLATAACTCGPLSNLTSTAQQAAEEAANEALQEASETIEAVEIEVEEQGEAAAQGAEEQEEPTTEDQDPSGPPADFVLGESGLENLSSYEYIQTVEFSGTDAEGQPVQTHLETHIIHQSEPFINSIQTLVTSTDAGGAISTWLVYMDGMSYTEFNTSDGRTCFAMPGDQADLETFDTSYYDLDPDEFSNFETEPEFVEISNNEDVNGIPSTHYRAENININSVESGSIDVWIANDGGYMTRMIMTGVGKDTELGDGQFDMTWELVSANQPVNVTPPADCETFEIPSQ